LAGATIDHLVSVIIFLAATLLFISLFNQTIQTAVIYQQHRAVATKCSDLSDTMLLTPNYATIRTWTAFGLQDPEFTQYTLSPFSLMRLDSSTGTPVYLQSKDNPSVVMEYSNMTVGFGNFLLMPVSDVINYSSALKMLGINNTYGFQLTLTPVVTISIAETSTNPLRLSISASGISFPLVHASVSYCLIPVSLNGAYPDYLTIQDQTGTVYTDAAGIASVPFPNFALDENLTYAFVAYAHVGGLAGVGFYEHASSGSQQLIPFVDSLSTQKVILAHSYDVPYTAVGLPDNLAYNATFVFFNEDFEFQEMQLANSTGDVKSGSGYPFGVITIPNYNPGILVIAYGNGTTGGVAIIPWGLGSLAFPVTFGGNSAEQEWVATDVRQVLVNGIAYQAKLSLWSYKGYQVMG
jgi:hypothetical protein